MSQPLHGRGFAIQTSHTAEERESSSAVTGRYVWHHVTLTETGVMKSDVQLRHPSPQPCLGPASACWLAIKHCVSGRLPCLKPATGDGQWCIRLLSAVTAPSCSHFLVGSAHGPPRCSRTARQPHRSSWAARSAQSCTAQRTGSSSTMLRLFTCRLGSVLAAAVCHGNGIQHVVM